MPKLKSVYICQSCENQTPNWAGQCPSCREWNTLIETVVESKITKPGSGASTKVRGSQSLNQLSKVEAKKTQRVNTKISEFDRVLGGGLVPGQVVLVGGEPGIGKSTLLMQLGMHLKSNILYVAGEESEYQIKLRAQRMGYAGDNLFVLSETNLDVVLNTIVASQKEYNLGLIIVDSIQMLYSDDLTGIPGSIGQLRKSTQALTILAKQINIPIMLVGHVTKDGTVAGPKVLEHIVDTVLILEGDSQHMYRILKTTKNRFGPVSEVGLFEMTEKGMEEVRNPSKVFLSEQSRQPGSCVAIVMEGFRPLLFEIQALVVPTSFGYPVRRASGFSLNRLQVLIAILEKRCGVKLGTYDVYINVVGGFKVEEYAADLSVCLAIVSSVKDTPVKESIAAFGECGLGGEVRKVSYAQKRTDEAKKLGFENVVSESTSKYLSQAIKKAL